MPSHLIIGLAAGDICEIASKVQPRVTNLIVSANENSSTLAVQYIRINLCNQF